MHDELDLACRWLEQSEAARSVGNAKLAEADALLCYAWSNFMFWNQKPSVSPTIGQADGPSLQCRTEDRFARVGTAAGHVVPNLDPALFCTKCSGAGRYRARAHILGLMPDPDDPEDGIVQGRSPTNSG